ncbi:uncharacterized protein LOC130815854 [Amaranthus tricolor]|uniref:uncharacterized protein LOC130815854 n=1 Tax=Amaranthus tricolor TaxID=29722 RepID=UPI00258B7CE5|nr:uncharacterized protein LOC130815854 [Amaranthus tricolor]
MKNTIRCCISCILPCGSLDVIRIIHTNGRVEEISGSIRAEEVMKAHPKHILKKPTSCPTSNDVVDAPDSHHRRPTIVVVPPDAQLQRGKIYFLIPVHDHHHQPSSGNSGKKKLPKTSASSAPSVSTGGCSSSTTRRKRREQKNRSNSISLGVSSSSSDGDKYLSDILSEKIVSRERRSRGRVAVWRPHLESICETLSEPSSTDH